MKVEGRREGERGREGEGGWEGEFVCILVASLQ
jgi:hypothetical protein